MPHPTDPVADSIAESTPRIESKANIGSVQRASIETTPDYLDFNAFVPKGKNLDIASGVASVSTGQAEGACSDAREDQVGARDSSASDALRGAQRLFEILGAQPCPRGWRSGVWIVKGS